MQTLLDTSVTPIARPVRSESRLDAAHELIQDGCLAAGLDEVFDHLSETRQDGARSWPQYAHACLEHPLCRILHQDPFTYRAFAKPRGYAGDAVMMDYIYGLGEAADAARQATPLGRAIFEYMGSRPDGPSVTAADCWRA